MNMGKNGNNIQTDIERLYHLHYEEMYQLAHSILHDEEEAKDVVSDIFTWLVDHYDEANAFQWNSYLLSSVRNHCQDIIRHRQVKQKAQSYLITESMAETPDDSTNTPDAVEIINYAESNMSAKTKKIFHLRYGENMSYREISHIMGISIPAVYKHILQARHKISARFVGILLALAMMARNAGLFSGSGPPAFTAMAICLPILVKVFAMCPHLFSFVALRYSNALPIFIRVPLS